MNLTHTLTYKLIKGMIFMPALIGAIKINSVGGSAVVNFGDAFKNAPSSSAKTNAGAGAFNTGDFIQTNNGLSSTNTGDPDISDQNTTEISGT
jgi:spore germination protein PF